MKSGRNLIGRPHGHAVNHFAVGFPVARSVAPRQPPAMSVRLRVVVIDDEPSVAEMTAFALSAQGFATEFAISGPAGLKLVQDTLPDAVVCDVRMPDLDGEQVLEQLRADARTQKIPVLFLSGQCHPNEVTRGDAFMQKPFHLKELAETVARLIAGRTAG